MRDHWCSLQGKKIDLWICESQAKLLKEKKLSWNQLNGFWEPSLKWDSKEMSCERRSEVKLLRSSLEKRQESYFASREQTLNSINSCSPGKVQTMTQQSVQKASCSWVQRNWIHLSTLWSIFPVWKKANVIAHADIKLHCVKFCMWNERERLSNGAALTWLLCGLRYGLSTLGRIRHLVRHGLGHTILLAWAGILTRRVVRHLYLDAQADTWRRVRPVLLSTVCTWENSCAHVHNIIEGSNILEKKEELRVENEMQRKRHLIKTID